MLVKQQTFQFMVVKRRWYHKFFNKFWDRDKLTTLAKINVPCEVFLDKKGTVQLAPNVSNIDADDCPKNWEERFEEWIEEFPLDPSAPQAHFQTEEEYDQAYEKYRDQRERDAFQAGFGHE